MNCRIGAIPPTSNRLAQKGHTPQVSPGMAVLSWMSRLLHGVQRISFPIEADRTNRQEACKDCQHAEQGGGGSLGRFSVEDAREPTI